MPARVKNELVIVRISQKSHRILKTIALARDLSFAQMVDLAVEPFDVLVEKLQDGNGSPSKGKSAV